LCRSPPATRRSVRPLTARRGRSGAPAMSLCDKFRCLRARTAHILGDSSTPPKIASFEEQGGNWSTSNVLLTHYFLINCGPKARRSLIKLRAEGPHVLNKLPKAAFFIIPVYLMGLINWAGRRRQPELISEV